MAPAPYDDTSAYTLVGTLGLYSASAVGLVSSATSLLARAEAVELVQLVQLVQL